MPSTALREISVLLELDNENIVKLRGDVIYELSDEKNRKNRLYLVFDFFN